MRFTYFIIINIFISAFLWAQDIKFQELNDIDLTGNEINFIKLNDNVEYYCQDNNPAPNIHELYLYLKVNGTTDSKFFEYRVNPKRRNNKLVKYSLEKLQITEKEIYFLKLNTIPDIEAGPLSNSMNQYLIVLDNNIPGIYELTRFSFGHEFNYDATKFYYPEKSNLNVLIVNHVYPNYNTYDSETDKLLSYSKYSRFFIDLNNEISVTNLKLGKINDNGLRIRESFSLDSKVIDKLDKNTIVYISGQSEKQHTIGDMNDFWYRVYIIEKNISGWSYGAFIDILE